MAQRVEEAAAGGTPAAAAPAVGGPPPAELDRLRKFLARADVPAAAKQSAAEAFRRQYPPPGLQPPATAAPTAPAAAPAAPPAPARPEGAPAQPPGPIARAGVPTELRAPTTLERIRGALPRTGPFGFLAQSAFEYATNPEELAATAGALGATALVSAAPPLLIPAVALGAGGAREIVARYYSGRTPSWTERGVKLLLDAAPVAVGSWLQRIIMSKPEVEAITARLARGRELERMLPEERAAATAAEKAAREAELAPERAAVTAAEERVAAAKGAVPKKPPEPGMAAIPVTPEAPVGPETTRIVATALKESERTVGTMYRREVAEATRLGLETPTPRSVMDAAGDALEAIERSGLEPEAKGRAIDLLTDIRDATKEKVKLDKDGNIIEVIRGPITRTTYADLDAWRQKLQTLAPAFSQLGRRQTFEKGSLGRVLGMVKDEMDRLAGGTPVARLAREADDFLIHEVRPMQELSRAVLRGEHEANALVDALTNRANISKFGRLMRTLEREDPAQARAIRQVKYQNMIERATDLDGTLKSDAFLKELQTLPPETRKLLLADESEIRQLFDNIRSARELSKTTTQEGEALLQRAQTDYAQALSEFEAAAARAGGQLSPELISARRKLSSTQAAANMGLQGALGVFAARSMLHGNPYPMLAWVAGGRQQATGFLAFLFASPRAVKNMNRVFRVVGAGASPNVIARTGYQMLYHMTLNATLPAVGPPPRRRERATTFPARPTAPAVPPTAPPVAPPGGPGTAFAAPRPTATATAPPSGPPLRGLPRTAQPGREAVERAAAAMFPGDAEARRRLLALAWQESSFNPEAVGDAGKAHGMFQLWPEVRKRYGGRRSEPPESQALAAASYLRDLITKHGGDWDRAIAEFHLGEPKFKAGKRDERYMREHARRLAAIQ